MDQATRAHWVCVLWCGDDDRANADSVHGFSTPHDSNLTERTRWACERSSLNGRLEIKGRKLRDTLVPNRDPSAQIRPLHAPAAATARVRPAIQSLPPRSERQAGLTPREISSVAPGRPRLWTGLVQQTIYIVASLRSHDLTLVVRTYGSAFRFAFVNSTMARSISPCVVKGKLPEEQNLLNSVVRSLPIESLTFCTVADTSSFGISIVKLTVSATVAMSFFILAHKLFRMDHESPNYAERALPIYRLLPLPLQVS